jgi:hypothetical protein
MRMLNLDLSLPFVDQAFTLMRGDIAAEGCIETLRLYEKKSELQLVAPDLEISRRRAMRGQA